MGSAIIFSWKSQRMLWVTGAYNRKVAPSKKDILLSLNFFFEIKAIPHTERKKEKKTIMPKVYFCVIRYRGRKISSRGEKCMEKWFTPSTEE